MEVPGGLRSGLAIGLVSLLLLWRSGLPFNPRQFSRLNAGMVLLGKGSVLLETKALVQWARVFTSTWVVYTVVLPALLVMLPGANLWVLKWKLRPLTPLNLVLLTATVVNIAAPLDGFLSLRRALQGVEVGVLAFSPIFCAGVFFARPFARALKPDQALPKTGRAGYWAVCRRTARC